MRRTVLAVLVLLSIPVAGASVFRSATSEVDVTVSPGATARTYIMLHNDGTDSLTVELNAAGRILINEICTNPDAFELMNQGRAKDMTGWGIEWYDNAGTSGTYFFPGGFVFPARGIVVLHEGSGTDTDSSLYMGDNLNWLGRVEMRVEILRPGIASSDFFRTLNYWAAHPGWYGDGLELVYDFPYRKYNDDDDDAGDWWTSDVNSLYSFNEPYQSPDPGLASWMYGISSADTVIAPGDSVILELDLDADDLTAGTYTDTFFITHNDTGQVTPFALPVSMTVPYERHLYHSSWLDCGSPAFGDTSVTYMELVNDGNRTTTVDSVSVTGSAFAVDASFPLTVSAFGQRSIAVRFAPSDTGETEETLRVYSNADDRPVLTVRPYGHGSGSFAEFDPGSLAVTVEPGRTGSGFVRIRNHGNYSLRVAPAEGSVMINEVYADGDEAVELWNRGPEQDLGGWSLEWTDNGGTSGSFNIPYGTTLGHGGRLVVREGQGYDNDSTVYLDKLVSWWRIRFSIALLNESDIGVDFIRCSGNYAEPPFGTYWNGDGISSSSGNLYRNSDADTDGPDDWSGSDMSTFHRANPGQAGRGIPVLASWANSSLSSITYVQPGEYTSVLVSLDPGTRSAGTYRCTLAVSTDDGRLEEPHPVPVIMTVPSIGRLATDTDTLRFGNVAVGDSLELDVTVSNSGNTFVTVDSLSVTGAPFSVVTAAPLYVFGSGSKTVRTVFTVTDTGVFSGALYIGSTADDNPEITVVLLGTGRYGAEVSLPADGIRAVVNPGGSVTRTLDVVNPGDAELAVRFYGTDMAGAVIINEVCTNPDAVELWNPGPERDLTGWQLVWDDNDGWYDFPDGFTLPHGAYVVVHENYGTDTDTSLYTYDNWPWVTGSELSLALYDSTGVCIDFMRTAGNTDPVPTGSAWYGTGVTPDLATLERVRVADTDSASDWGSTASHTLYGVNGAQTGTSGLPAWLSIDPDTAMVPAFGSSGVPFAFDAAGLGTGTYACSVFVSHNAQGQPDPLAVVCTLRVAHLPQIVSAAVDTATEELLYEYVAAAADSDDVPSVSFIAYPGWCGAYGDTLRGTPPFGTHGDTSFMVIAHDGEFADTLVVALAVKDSNGLVPVVLSSFTATGSGADVLLEWVTESEDGNLGFNVLRSTEPDDGFAVINERMIPGAGTTASPCSYSYTDAGVPAGLWYYRLEQVDMGGQVTVSDAVSVEAGVSGISVHGNGALVSDRVRFYDCSGMPLPGMPSEPGIYLEIRHGTAYKVIITE